jgi:4-diphosphocytidyl-2-C-methyl-D-erythritol kinase
VTIAKLRAAAPDLQFGTFSLLKNLPVAAGIGGGSADAAAVLRAVRRANPRLASRLDWLAIARSIGADVPVCFGDRAAWMTGIGDCVQPLDALPPLAAVLVNPLQAMPDDKTAHVFRTLNAAPMQASDAYAKPEHFHTPVELLAFMRTSGNALEAAACAVAPVIGDIKRALEGVEGCQYAAVSGSGPTCFAIFADAATAATQLKRAHPHWWIRAVQLS